MVHKCKECGYKEQEKIFIDRLMSVIYLPMIVGIGGFFMYSATKGDIPDYWTLFLIIFVFYSSCSIFNERGKEE